MLVEEKLFNYFFNWFFKKNLQEIVRTMRHKDGLIRNFHAFLMKMKILTSNLVT